MRKILFVLLAVMLPLQFVWGSAAAYCTHEPTSQQEAHFGHHAHVHKVDKKKITDVKTFVDYDCSVCFLSGVPAMQPSFPSVEPPRILTAGYYLDYHPLPSAPARKPERPQWHRLA